MSMSPYCAMGTNPINYTDPDGDIIGPWLIPFLKTYAGTMLPTVTVAAATTGIAAAATVGSATAVNVAIQSIPSGSSHFFNGGSFYNQKPLVPDGYGFVEQSLDMSQSTLTEHVNISGDIDKGTMFQTNRGYWIHDNSAFRINDISTSFRNHYKFYARMGGIDGITSNALAWTVGGVAEGGAMMASLGIGGKIVGGGRGIWTATRSKSAVRNAYSHWTKHSSDFPKFNNAKQYVEGARKFLTNSPKGTMTKVRSNGDILKYHSKSNTFGVMNSNRIPKTMFKPTDRLQYWLRQ